MNLFKKIATLCISAAILVSGMSLTAFADAEGSAEGAGEETVTVPAEPALTSGAVCSEISPSASSIEKNTKFDLTITTLIPMVNCNDSAGLSDIPLDTIAVTALNNDSFIFSNTSPSNYRYWFAGSFVCVSTVFNSITYNGKGNTFSYLVSYTGANHTPITTSLSGFIPGCVEYEEKVPNDPKTDTPSFVLKSSKTYTVKAGTKSTLKFSLGSIGKGRISQVSASLSSMDPGIIVEDMGEKTSASYAPNFDFPISVLETTSAGIHNLTLKIQVYDENGNITSSTSYDIPVSVTSGVVNTGLTVESYKVSKEQVKSGDKFTLSLKLKNNCGIDLDNVSVSLGIDDTTKFALNGGFSKQSVDIAKGKTSDVTFTLIAGDGIKAEREMIGVKASYRIDATKAETEQSFDTSVIISCKPKDAGSDNNKYALSMTNYSVSETEIKDGTHFRLDITVTNTGKTDIRNARLALMGLDGGKFAADEGLTYADFNIAAGKSKSFSFKLVGCAGIASIREVIDVHIEFGEVSTDSYATVSCKPKKTNANGDEEGDVFAPNIIIESYDFGSTFVTAGQTFPLNVVIKNVSSNALIENLKVTLNGASNSTDGSIAYSPANSSNSFFFETLGPKASTNVSLDLLAKSDASPNSYPVQISFEYEYSVNDKRYKANGHNETLTIPLQQEDRLSINEPESPGYAVGVGDMCNISVSIVNKGKSSAYNVSATISGEGFTTENPTYYIGNVDSGKEEYYDAQITPQQEGEIEGTITFTYEDSNGTAKEQVKTFKFNAVTMNFGGMYGDGFYIDDGMMMDTPPQEEGSMTWLWFVIGGVVVVIVGIIITVNVVKKSKARKLQRELEEDDEDN